MRLRGAALASGVALALAGLTALATVLAAAEAEENVRRAIGGKPVRKRIYVPGRIVNFVV